MRTTVTLDPDVAAKLRRLARERGVSFKEAINGTLRAGLGARAVARPYRTPARALGLRPGIDLNKALSIAAAMEDEEIIRKLDLRK
ncbi:MAG TPA: CopG family transcriptional regulator [Candidatus Limnocylindria bacterium]